MSDWDRFVDHNPELDKRASELIMTLAHINRLIKTATHPDEVEDIENAKKPLLEELVQVQIKRGIMKGPEDK